MTESQLRMTWYIGIATSLAGLSILFPAAYVAWMLLIGFVAYCIAVGVVTAIVVSNVLDWLFPIEDDDSEYAR